MKIKKFIFLIYLVSVGSFCQKSIPIYGTVLDSIGTIDNANVLNRTSNIGTNTNLEGLFKIFCQVGDTLVISSVQHETKKIIVKKNSFNNFNFQVYLKIKTYELDEFDLKKHHLSGALALDVKGIKHQRNDINAVTLDLPGAGFKKLTQVEREIYTATTSSGPIPLDLILNSITGRLKMLKEKKKIVEDNADVNKLYEDYKYNLSANFKIDKEDEFRFLYFCRSDSTYTTSISKNKFEFIKFLQKKAIEFNKNKNE